MNAKESLHQTPPPILYHYTNQHGLLGIIKSREIWASHTQYLNDTSEFRHAIDLVLRVAAEMAALPDLDAAAKNFVAGVKQSLSFHLEAMNVCVCSFSENGDLLSQWRAYGGPSSGFAIGFSGESLRKLCGDTGWLAPAIYHDDEQRMLIRTLLEDVIHESRVREKSGEEKIASTGNLLPYLHRYAPMLKHRAFAEEREWRIITRPCFCSHERFGYRPGPSMLIPYFGIALQDGANFDIREVVVGPTPYPEQSQRSVNGLLVKNGFQMKDAFHEWGVNVRCSEIPYRNW